jgi:class 3 adenylate cyclase/predicted negative regulator of RcsB-dependent stress response
MGSVYLALDTHLDRLVALKIPDFGPERQPHFLERFYREARAAAALHHPNLCPVFDVGDIDGVHYLSMAYIEGRTLAELAPELRRQSPHQTVELVRKLALALEEAHRLGVIHRDLKPSNILIDGRGEPVVVDFGLARRAQWEETITHYGVPMGTPAYMPPEQVTGDVEAMGPGCDIYSLGVILYELLTGQRPFHGPAISVLTQTLEEEPPAPSQLRPDLDPRLDGIIRRALAKKVEQRFASMADFATALAGYLQGEPTPVPGAADTLVSPPTNPESAREVLGLLRTWGWGAGMRRLKEAAQSAVEEPHRQAYQFFHGWLSGDQVPPREAIEPFQSAGVAREVEGWSLAGQALAAVQERDFARAHRLLDQAAALGDPTDVALKATIAHNRGVVDIHQGKFDRALPALHEALALFGKEHFAAGRVLDSLGMLYAGKENFQVAREFYEQALLYKERLGDEAGQAVSHGQLGRLHRDWGNLDLAEEHFQADLRLSQKIQDGRGEAQMYNHLGEVALARGEREAAAGRKAAAHRRWTEAAGWLDLSIRKHCERNRVVPEGYARKDRALVHLAEGNPDAAEQEARRAEALFVKARYAEGLAQANRVLGIALRCQGRFEEAARRFRAALSHFEEVRDHAETARTLWELARTWRAADPCHPLATQTFLEALERAESCRRSEFVRAIEEELSEADHEAYFRHVYRRARGPGGGEDAPSLAGGSAEAVSVLFFDLQGFTDYSVNLEPGAVMMTLNQMMADLAPALARHRAVVTTYFGDSFLALIREPRHAERAVLAAIDLVTALADFNRPRDVLGLPLFAARIAVGTGEAFLGNVGTYQKMDYTAVGAPVSQAFRLVNWATPGVPCVSAATHALIRDEFEFRADSPRRVSLPGLGEWELWDVIGRRSR